VCFKTNIKLTLMPHLIVLLIRVIGFTAESIMIRHRKYHKLRVCVDLTCDVVMYEEIMHSGFPMSWKV